MNDDLLNIMMDEEESINDIHDLRDYEQGYNANPVDVDLDKESDAFRAGHYQREIDDDCMF